MMIRPLLALAVTAVWLGLAGPVQAHPHVFVTARGEVVYAADGTVQSIRFAWTFDEAFSAFATQGLDTDRDGKLARGELAELAQVNVTSLKEFDYFTYAKSGGKTVALEPPVDYWLEADANKLLTLHFTLPFKDRPKGPVTFEVYDPTYFVAFQLAEGEAVKLVGAPAGCRLDLRRPEPMATSTTRLSESFFNALTAASQYGSQFANQIAVLCP